MQTNNPTDWTRIAKEGASEIGSKFDVGQTQAGWKRPSNP